jgi:3'(2'), 5'-bisphosphate nucleotidase
MINVQTAEVQFAVEAVRQAAQLVKMIQREMVTPALTKEDRSPVTIADYASQALVSHLLDTTFPADALVGEEDATALRQPGAEEALEQVTNFVRDAVHSADAQRVLSWIDRGGGKPASRFWTLDPIDGTKGFLRSDQYAVALALLVNGTVQVGVLGCPNLIDGWKPDFSGQGSLLIAVKGEGTWVMPMDGNLGNSVRLSVSTQSTSEQARILRSFESGHTNVDQIEKFAEILGIRAEPVRMDSQAKYAVLAAGQGELILRLLSPKAPDYREKIWDQAAGSLVVEEAGGKVTDLAGKPFDFTQGRVLANNRGVLASNGALHHSALESLRKIRA